MTTQEAYEGMRAWFSRPDAVLGRDVDESDDEGIVGTCVYRGGNDPASPVRCAIGCLIPNDLYSGRFEGRSARELIFGDEDDGPDAPEIAFLFEGVNDDWLVETQERHDCHSKDAADFVLGLDELAKVYGLTRP